MLYDSTSDKWNDYKEGIGDFHVSSKGWYVELNPEF